MPVQNVEQSGEGELVDSGHFDGEDPGGRIHAVRDDVARRERDDSLLGERNGSVASKSRRMT